VLVHDVTDRQWAQYYAQQGYDAAQIAAATAYTSNKEAHSASTYDPQAYAAYNTASGSGSVAGPSHPAAPVNLNPHLPMLDAELFNQSSAYLPGAAQEIAKAQKKNQQGKRDTVVRKGNGRTWEDPTLLEWDPSELGSAMGWTGAGGCDETADKYRVVEAVCRRLVE
jgi:hypothetical protein